MPAAQLGAVKLPPIATRAIVVDAVPNGRTWLSLGETIKAAELEASISAAGLRCEPGDALIVRTGSIKDFRSGTADSILSGDSMPMASITNRASQERFLRHLYRNGIYLHLKVLSSHRPIT